jgi:hypothetical protein
VRNLCLLVVLLYARSGFSQEYPIWFLNEREVGCGNAAVGFAKVSFYRDSAIALSFRQGCEAIVRQSAVKIAGGQSFWATEAGTYWMGTDIREEYDTSKIAGVCNQVVALDTFAADAGVFVLVGQHGCMTPGLKGKTVSLAGKGLPSWTEDLPRDGEYVYAVGVAPRYFYETSSWTEAERAARRNLARTLLSHVKSLQKRDEDEAQDVRQEDLSVVVKDYRVVARWRDMKTETFYVLVRMPVE